MRYMLPGLFFSILVLFFWLGLSLDPSEVPSPLVGKPGPTFELPELQRAGEVVSNETMAGQPALLNVWATWCAACRLEHDTLLALSSSKAIPIYGLNYKDDRQSAIRWLDQLGDPYTAVAFDPDGMVGLDWGVYGAPETFLLDPNGVVVYKYIAPISLAVWRDEFVPRIEKMQGGGQ